MADERNLRWSDSDSDDDDDPSLARFINRVKPDSVILATLQNLADATKSASPSETLTLTNLSLSSTDEPSFCSDERGSLAGRLTFREDDRTVDCSSVGSVGIPIGCDIDQVGDMRSDALFILVVQNFSTFSKLIRSRYYNRFPCIVLWVKRKPDVSTRLFLRKMKSELKLPVLAFVNGDPFALKILSVYELDIKWVGIRPSDLDRYKIPNICRLPMKKKDIKDAKDLLEDDFVKKNPGWVEELTLMLKLKQKVEIDALSYFGARYLTEIYIPFKLQQQDWV